MTARSLVGLVASFAVLATAATERTSASATTAPTTSLAAAGAPAIGEPETATTTTAPIDLLGSVRWIQREFASPCSDGSVQMIGGSAIDGTSLAVIDDVIPLDPEQGLALAFLSCHARPGVITASTALLVSAGPGGLVSTVAERELGAGARVVATELPSFTVERPDGPPPGTTSCCAPLVRRTTYAAGRAGIDVAGERQVAAFLQTVAPAAIAGDGAIVRASIPAAALCYEWDQLNLVAPRAGQEPTEMSQPSAELQTVRLALIHVTDRWITPAPYMSREMSEVVRVYQESRGLTVDGEVGAETTNALRADLGCPPRGSFNQVVPPGLGPRRFTSIADLLVATERYAGSGSTGNVSLDGLLASAGWDAANSMFLGCSRWQSPPAGISCAWSGPTPLQLIGLLDDPASSSISSFSILYARSALPT